ncbi:tRNA glutamyl-Q(34) synthetase GluQRS [Heliophilum fasciatum]|uniref:Glutamyl-Q tRNA(Asp) synthetase n=1 Tax=Heliophilum fasciatum TaxID=35700 RepID=A0A4R2RYN3_9FIRM|nr:tRNA glutamyl-Q(34) synthetase GluQRS [Heliophilum fasciatum]MCW2277176.1 glutamyl-tRNA synthetase [Heliophilum fasciatum]TCP68189.1 glutamyl-tRNA synthetase [Heliophilum fasciatum]
MAELSPPIVGRYAPSPTGQLHLGNARTALLAWLQVRQAGGRFILRMEDLDPARSSPTVAKAIIEDLRWLGLDWDEGPDVGGPHGPYCQSERRAFYTEALEKLWQQELIYPCTCSRKDLASVAHAPHGAADDPPPYPGHCRHRRRSEQEALCQSDHRWSLRFHVPAGIVAWQDALAGTIIQDVARTVGDFIVYRADHVIAYQLAVVVDDAAMGITDVLRGDDLLSSTARQIQLGQALGLPIPRYAHVPLLYGPDGARLAKRHGATAIAALRDRGWRAAEITGWLAASAGLLPDVAPINARDLVATFALSDIAKHRVDPVALWSFLA